MTHLAYLLTNAFQTKMTPWGLPWTLWLHQLDPHWCMLRITVGKPKGEGYDPWKLGFVDGKFQDSGAQGYENTMFATCENSEHVPVTATLRSHLNFFLPEDILRSFNFWTPRVSEGIALHGGKWWCSPMQNLYLQNAQVFWSRSSSGVKLPSLCVYLCILIHLFFCLVLKAPNLYILQYFIFWNLWQGSCVPQNLFPFNIDSRSATAEAWIHLSLPWEGTGTWYFRRPAMKVSWRGLINIINIMLELRTMLGVLHVIDKIVLGIFGIHVHGILAFVSFFVRKSWHLSRSPQQVTKRWCNKSHWRRNHPLDGILILLIQGCYIVFSCIITCIIRLYFIEYCITLNCIMICHFMYYYAILYCMIFWLF